MSGAAVSLDFDNLVETFYTRAVNHVSAVLDDCKLHGISEILYVENPSIHVRMDRLNESIALMSSLEKAFSVSPLTKIRITDSVFCFSYLRTLLESAETKDSASFEQAQIRLEAFLDTHNNVHVLLQGEQ